MTGDKETNTVRSEMQAPYRLLQASARNIAKVFKDAKLECDEEEYVKGFNAGKYCSMYMQIVLSLHRQMKKLIFIISYTISQNALTNSDDISNCKQTRT